MSYKELLSQVAEKHNTSCEEVEKEINSLLGEINCDMPAELFIACVAQQAKKTIYRKSYN